jgi:hypothetical protein
VREAGQVFKYIHSKQSAGFGSCSICIFHHFFLAKDQASKRYCSLPGGASASSAAAFRLRFGFAEDAFIDSSIAATSGGKSSPVFPFVRLVRFGFCAGSSAETSDTIPGSSVTGISTSY